MMGAHTEGGGGGGGGSPAAALGLLPTSRSKAGSHQLTWTPATRDGSPPVPADHTDHRGAGPDFVLLQEHL